MINYSKEYFGKNLNDLKSSDIENFFEEEKEESDKIEFKAFHPEHGNFNKNLEGVIRGICAFLNSNGGILIWGAPLGIKEDDRVVFKGDLSPVKELKEKDALISKISDSITPLPVNIQVEIIEYQEDYIYIFEVQQSLYCPHQYKNNYWVRLDGQTKPGPHYLIEALFKKISYPNVACYINLIEFGNHSKDYLYLDIEIIAVNHTEFQNEHNVVYRVTCPQALFLESQRPHSSDNYLLGGHQFLNDQIKILHFGGPDINTQRLIFNLDNIHGTHDGMIEIIVSFGGKNSPLKQSSYKLNLNRNTISRHNPVELFDEIEENKLYSTMQEEENITKEKFLESILKR